MAKTILILNGPNLNLLGQREPDIYGRETLADVEVNCRKACADGFDIETMHSNHEGVLIDRIQEARGAAAGIVINPGALSHTSIGLLDALRAFEGPVFEVHVSNIHAREEFRRHSYVSLRANGVIAGFGADGYEIAVRRVCKLLAATG